MKVLAGKPGPGPAPAAPCGHMGKGTLGGGVVLLHSRSEKTLCLASVAGSEWQQTSLTKERQPPQHVVPWLGSGGKTKRVVHEREP